MWIKVSYVWFIKVFVILLIILLVGYEEFLNEVLILIIDD